MELQNMSTICKEFKEIKMKFSLRNEADQNTTKYGK